MLELPLRCTLTLSHNDFVMSNHRVHGTSVMPGVTFLDLVCRVLRAAGGDPAGVVMRDVLFTSAVTTAPDLDRELRLEINTDGTLTAHSRALPDGDWHQNMVARLDFTEADDDPVLDVPAFLATSAEVRDLDSLYAQARQEDIVHGDPMRTHGRMYLSGAALLAEVDLHPSAVPQDAGFHVHPAKLDASTLIAFARTPVLAEPYIPIAIEAVRLPRGSTGRCYVFVPAQEVMAASGDVMSNSYRIHDTEGRLVAEFTRLTCKRIRRPELITDLVTVESTVEVLRELVGSALDVPATSVDIHAGFYDQGLDSVALLGIAERLEAVVGTRLYPTLLFEFNDIASLATHLDRTYGPLQPTAPAEVEPATDETVRTFAPTWRAAPIADRTFPGQVLLVADERGPAVAAALRARGTPVTLAEPSSINAQDAICVLEPANPHDAVHAVATAAIGTRPTRTIPICHIATASAEQAAVAALTRTITAETPILRCWSVTTDPLDADTVAALIQRELANPTHDSEVRYRQGHRETRALTPLTLHPQPLRPGTVCLVTGGAGGLGRLLTKHLVEKYQARVVLLGRHEPEDPGAEFIRADVTNPEEVQEAVEHVRLVYGRLHAVFHLAGVVDDGVYFRKDATQAVLAPKIAGTRALVAAVDDAKLVLFSSLSAVLANPGQSDYAYANAYLDHIAAERPNTVSINWPYWAEGGMRADGPGLPTEAGLAILDAAIGSDHPNVVVTYGQQPTHERTDRIAVIGLSGRYPQAPDLNAFWQLLASGKDAITEVPADRWDHDRIFDPVRGQPGHTYSRWGGFLDGVDRFAPAFFGISRREAEHMDPQERLFLQESWRALEDAGYPPETLTGERVGVFVGVMWNHYQLLRDQDGVAPTALHSSIPNRVSYSFDLTGPSMAVDTACSSSLVAVHLAVESIRRGESTMALAGGVNVTVHEQKYLQLAADQFLSDDGRCRAFGRDGTGYVPGEGVGVVVLKPLERALADGDHVDAVIEGTSVNHNGRTSGFTVPEPVSQGVLIRRALDAAGVPSVSYVEAHGTGTTLGDPIEIEGLTRAFADAPPGGCAVGSVKSNIGHLEGAAGIAGLTKVILQLRHRELVPSLHAEHLNEHIPFDTTPFYVQRARTPWTGAPLRAGVSAFGAGGTNAHVVVREGVPRPSVMDSSEPELVVLSATDEDSLRAGVKDLVDALPVPLRDIAFTLQVGRRALSFRLATVVTNLAELRSRLVAYLNGTADPSEVLVTGHTADVVDSLAKVWVDGGVVDWPGKGHRVSLPATRLPEERCWLGAWGSRDQPVPVVREEGGTPVRLTVLEQGIALVEMRDDVHRNMFTDEMLTWLERQFTALDARDDVRVIVLTGTEQVFCMGGEPEALASLAAGEGSFTDAAFVYEGLLRSRKPVVAAMRGHASGGGLAFGLYADVVVMSADGVYSANFLKYGFTPGMGATFVLQHRFGAALAAEMMLTARGYPGDELARRGAQVRVTAADQVLPTALDVARAITALPAEAVNRLKRTLADQVLERLPAVIANELEMHGEVLGAGAVELVRQAFTPSEVDRSAVVAVIEDALCAQLYLDRGEIDHAMSFSDMGVDSIGAVELVRDINRAFGTTIESVAVYDHPNVRQLADLVAGSREEPPSSPAATDVPIAVVGMSGRWPQAPDLHAYWDVIAEGRSTIAEVTRWSDASLPVEARRAALLSDVDAFDHRFFALSPLEAEETDPQQRLLLTEAWRALEDAGYAGSSGVRTRTGVFVGCARGDYGDLLAQAGRDDTAHAFLGSSGSILAARIGYLLDLRGPAVAVDTACSSSLVAVHLAAQSLRTGETDLALAGGVALMLTPSLHVRSARVGMLSATGTSAPFDASADGIVLGEGVGVVVLKRLADAVRDGDHIHGVLLSTGTNGDGHTNGITAPSATSQVDLLRAVHSAAGITPRDIGLVEAHGTGTPLGDPIEFAALREVFDAQPHEPAWCALGSVKGTVGHTTMAAGVASLIKVLLALRHRELPPSTGLTTPNPRISFTGSGLRPVAHREPWSQGRTGNRLATVSSFGFSGTNAHVVVAQPPEPRPRPTNNHRAELITLSARTPTELTTQTTRLTNAIQPTHNLSDIALTLALGRRLLPHRLAVVADSTADLQAKLTSLLAGDTPPGCVKGMVPPSSDPQRTLSIHPERLIEAAEGYVTGVDLDWAKWFKNQKARRTPLPTYPLRTDRHWITQPPQPTPPVARPSDLSERGPVPSQAPGLPRTSGVGDQLGLAGRSSVTLPASQTSGSPVTGQRSVTLPSLSEIPEDPPSATPRGHESAPQLIPAGHPQHQDVDLDPNHPFVTDHVINGEPLLPAAATAVLVPNHEFPVRLAGVRWLRPFAVTTHRPLHIDMAEGRFRLGDPESPHATGTITQAPPPPSVTIADHPENVDVEAMYRSFEQAGMSYGPTFRLLSTVTRTTDEAVATLAASAEPTAVLDASFQAIAALVEDDATLLPIGAQAIDLYAPLTQAKKALVRTRGNLRYDIHLTDQAGQPVAVVTALTLHRVDNITYVPVWRQATPPKPLPRPRQLVALTTPAGRPLAEKLRPDLVLPLEADPGAPDCVYVIAVDPPEDPTATMLNLVQTLAQRRASDSLRLIVVTSGTVTTKDEPIRPEAATLLGFTNTVAAEYPKWRVGCVDVTGIPDLTGEDATHRLVAIRDQTRLTRTFDRSSLPPGSPYRQGVYLLIGGAGGLGAALSKHLANTGAQLVWIGRRPESEITHAAEVHYIQADVTNAQQLTQAVSQAEKLGPLVGVVHTAVTLRDRPLSTMSERDLQDVLAPKVKGLQTLGDVLRGKPLDFVALFSSAASFVDSRGQANYAAASTYEDAYGHWLRQTGLPVTVVNWGYWGTVGAVADDHHRALLAADGIKSLDPTAAFEALDRALAAHLDQVLIVNATQKGFAHFTPQDTNAAKDYVKGIFAEVLKYAPDEIDPTLTFEHYGIDSVVGTRLLDRMRQDLGDLPSTLLFEANTVDQLADRLSADHPVAFTPPAPTTQDDIAIVGVSGRYPGAPDLDVFWQNLLAGRTSITEVPAHRWDWRARVDPERGLREYQRWGGFLSDVDKFDAALFGVLPKDAVDIDPQERLFLENCWTLLEQTGYLGEHSREPATGVFVGVMYGTYGELGARASERGIPSGAHSAYWSIANRVSYTFDFDGPSLAVDTACSSSLTALHLACESIRAGECRAAIAGGVNLILDPSHFLALGARNMLAGDGVVKVFDANADGYVPGEGVGAVLVKRLSDAIADGDHVWAVIRGTALNAGGKTSGYSVPNPNAQAAVVERALRRAGVAPGTIGYVEAHGSGTALGDPIELAGLTHAFHALGARPGRCAIGSVKSNIGHLEGAAGIAGLTKVLLQLRHQTLVPAVGLTTPNPKIDFNGSPVHPQLEAAHWPSPRAACISSFGAGGANAHVVLTELPTQPRPTTPKRDETVVLSAPDTTRLTELATALATQLTHEPSTNLAGLAYTSQVGRRAFPERLAVVCPDIPTLRDELTAFAAGRPSNVMRATATHTERTEVGDSIEQAWLKGVRVDWRSLWPKEPARVAFPTTSFLRTRYWLDEGHPKPAAQIDNTQPVYPVTYERTEWIPRPIAGEPASPRAVQIVTDGSDLAERVAAEVATRLVQVEGGGAVVHLASGTLTPADLAQRAAADAIVHLASGTLTPATDPASDLHAILDPTVKLSRPRILSVRLGADTGEQPHLIALSGLVRTLAAETGGTGTSLALDIAPPETLADQVVNELRQTQDPDVAYRSGQRLVRTDTPFTPPPPDPGWVAKDGAYLITGGAGGLGRHFARLLVARGAGEVVLAGRSPVDLDLGPSVRYVQADITDPTQLLKDIRLPLRGVLHAAGVLRDRRAVDLEPQDVADVLAPKVAGALALDQATATDQLDFFVLFSSVVGQSGNPGQAAYAYANAFLDSFAETRERMRARGSRTGRTRSIAWPLWRDGGMTVEQSTIDLLARRWGMAPLSTEAGLQAFERILAGPDPVVTVVERTTSVLDRLRGLAAEFLLVAESEVDVRTELLDLGFDSISLTELITRVNRELGLDLLPTVVFEYPTLAALADHLDHAPKPTPAVATTRGGDVAVIGMAATFPGSPDVDEFWRHLAAGDDLVGRVPEDRAELLADPRTQDVKGGFLDHIGEFDAELFGVAPREAAMMDPQQRLFLQAAWQAIADAGYRDLAGSSTGLFVGVSTSDYEDLLTIEDVPVEAHTATGLSHAVLANRVSYLLDLRGPSEAVDTACSSALVAVHRAVRALRSGECALAIAGGVGVTLTPGLFVAFQQSGMLSAAGRCATFDSAADGYVRGEGVGALLLKPLDQALADGDPIHAVVKGSAVNHGGRAASLTAPNPRAQADVLTAAYADAGVSPDTVTYLEAHGTGTRLGDPVEIEGVKHVFPDRTVPLVIGSVKTNIGHLEAAAGIAGLVKTILAIRHQQIPPHLHLHDLNPYIRLAGTPLVIPSELRPWPANTRRAGVSSFGFGGTNAHVVLEEAPIRQQGGDGPLVFVLSAPSQTQLTAYAHHLADQLPTDLAGVAYTLQTGRETYPVRLAIAADERSTLIAGLRAAQPVGEGLAARWMAGEDIDWASLWKRRPHRVSIPTFPLARTSYWYTDQVSTVEVDPVRRHLAELLGVEAGTIPGDKPFTALGLDSIYTMDLAERLAAEFGRNLQAAELYEHDTVDAIIAYLQQPDLLDVLTEILGRPLDPVKSFVDNGLDSLDMLRVVSELEDRVGPLPKTLLYDHPDVAALTSYLDGKHYKSKLSTPEVATRGLVVAKRAVTPDLADLITDLTERHGTESGLAGRDIAPLLFVPENRRGFLEFTQDNRATLVWGYTGPPESYPDTLAAFADGRAINVLSPTPLTEIGDRPATASPFGVVQHLPDLGEFTLDGGEMRRLRSLLNRFAKSGTAQVGEYAPGSDTRTDAGIVALIDDWSATKATVNPYVTTVRDDFQHGTLDPDHRVFLTHLDGVLVAAVVITAMPAEDGWLLDVEFYRSDLPLGGMDHTIVSIINTLRAEGVRVFSLGATFGVPVGQTINPSPAIAQEITELAAAGMTGKSNYQFKRKFRPQELPIYLCQPKDQPTSAADVLLMIATPRPVQPAVPARTEVLAAAGWNPLLLTHHETETDLLTDSWAERDDPWMTTTRHSSTAGDPPRTRDEPDAATGPQRTAALPGWTTPPWLPFPTVVPTPSGRAAEQALCRAWPGRPGNVPHNGLFPTWLFALADRRFTPVPLVHSGGDLPPDLLKAALDTNTAMVVIEPGSNASGGQPMSLSNLREIHALTSARNVPLILDATRLLDNVIAEEGDPWSRMHDILNLADAVTMSLSKDFGVHFGGLVATRLTELAARLREGAAQRGTDVSLVDRGQLAAALADQTNVLKAVQLRAQATSTLWQALTKAGLPATKGGHCVLIDAAKMVDKGFTNPVAACLAWLYEHTGIRGGPHLAGDAHPDLRTCIRLAVPVGASLDDVATWTARLDLTKPPVDLEVVTPGPPESRTYRPRRTWFQTQLNELGRSLQSDEYAPADENLAVLEEFHPTVDHRVIDDQDGVVEVFLAGTGPVLVLMHPFNIGAGMFAPQLAGLADRFTVVVPHQPGVGKTTVDTPLSFAGIAALQRRVLKALGIDEPVHVGGASVGAIFAESYTLRYPEGVRTMSLLGGSYKFANRKGRIDKLTQVIAEDFAQIRAGGSTRTDEEVITERLLRCESMDPQTGLRYLDLFAKEPALTDQLGDITVPTLVVQGRHDSVVGVKTGHFLHGAIPNARYLELPESGHFVCFTDAERVTTELGEFLTDG